MAHIVNPADYLPAENQESFGTPEEQTQFGVDQMAAGLARRQQIAHDLGGITDEDLDSDNFDPKVAQAESLLNEAIANASRATNPAERARWSNEAERLAEALVSNQHGKPIKNEGVEEISSARKELENSGYNVQGILEHAGSVLDDAAIEEWDSIVKSDDKQLAKHGVTLLRQMQNFPDHFVMDREDFNPIPESLGHEISQEFGDHVAHVLETTSLAVANGLDTPSNAYRVLRSDQAVHQAFITLLQRGTIQMPMFGGRK